MDTPTKASSHFINLRYDDAKKKHTMQCKHCMKILIDCKNTTCRVSHLRSCQPNIPLTNKITSIRKFQIDLPSSASDSSSSSQSPPSTVKSTPLKSMLLSHTPYPNDSNERKKILNSLLELLVDMNLPISTVDHPSFVRYSSALNNRFRIPCRQTMRSTIIPQKVCFYLFFLNINRFNIIK